MRKVYLAKGREVRPLGGHPWIYQSDIARIEGEGKPGEVAEVLDARGRFLGRGYLNPGSQIAVRLLTWEDEAVEASLLRRRIVEAVERRRRLVAGTTAWRAVYGEGDRLPGLIVDRYGDLVVIQTLTAGMELFKEALVAILQEVLEPAGIYERNDAPARRLEGLDPRKGFLAGGGETARWIEEGGVAFLVDVATGQKTGFFLDQRENRVAVGALAAGREVLDAFCYSGGFGLHAAKGGARAVLGIDLSAEAVALAARNAERNGVGDRATFQAGNAFDGLRALQRAGRAFDLIVLDPPAFTRSRDAVAGALRGYKEINLRAMKLLRPGGILVTCSCSYHLDQETFLGVLQAAAADAGRRFHLRDYRTQARDHPILLGVRETQYLKCVILEVLG